jgi:hypothetical protein
MSRCDSLPTPEAKSTTPRFHRWAANKVRVLSIAIQVVSHRSAMTRKAVPCDCPFPLHFLSSVRLRSSHIVLTRDQWYNTFRSLWWQPRRIATDFLFPLGRVTGATPAYERKELPSRSAITGEASASRVAVITRPTPGKDRITATSVGSPVPCSLVSDRVPVSSSSSASLRAATSARCCLRRRRRGSNRSACSLAASRLPGQPAITSRSF